MASIFFQQYFSHAKTGSQVLPDPEFLETIFSGERFRESSEQFCQHPRLGLNRLDQIL
jgi:hypothetical protein